MPKVTVLSAALFAVILVACSPPCDQLAEAICNCEPDANVAAACKTQVSADAANIKPTAADQKYCAAKLKTCSCERLGAGDRGACGLTIE